MQQEVDSPAGSGLLPPSFLARPSGWTRALLLLALGVFCLQFGFGIHLSIFNNFIAEKLGIEAHQLGVMESIREMPGFLSAFVSGLFMFLAEPTLAAICLLVMASGFVSYVAVETWGGLILASLLWSTGFHVWAPLSSTLVLGHAEAGQEGRRLGQIGAVGAIAGPVGIAVVYVCGRWLGYGQMFLLAGGAVALAGVVVSRVPPPAHHPNRRPVVFRRHYGLYYALTLLDGCRKQIFMTFAIFVLVKVYHVPLHRVALLMLINGVGTMLVAPRVGRLVDRWGERRALVLNYLAVLPLFCGYALVHRVGVLYLLYCLDSLLFSFNIAISTYLKKIALPEEVRPSFAMGVTCNHLAAVITPLVGGLLWRAVGYEAAFWAGAVVVVASLAAAARLPGPQALAQVALAGARGPGVGNRASAVGGP